MVAVNRVELSRKSSTDRSLLQGIYAEYITSECVLNSGVEAGGCDVRPRL